MPIIPSVPLSLAPVPTHHRPYPWRFSLGDTVYVLGHPSAASFKVVGGELWFSFPHLHLVDETGHTWRIPQLHCSSKTITFRKG